jgi:hypothetical protein
VPTQIARRNTRRRKLGRSTLALRSNAQPDARRSTDQPEANPEFRRERSANRSARAADPAPAGPAADIADRATDRTRPLEAERRRPGRVAQHSQMTTSPASTNSGQYPRHGVPSAVAGNRTPNAVEHTPASATFNRALMPHRPRPRCPT